MSAQIVQLTPDNVLLLIIGWAGMYKNTEVGGTLLQLQGGLDAAYRQGCVALKGEVREQIQSSESR